MMKKNGAFLSGLFFITLSVAALEYMSLKKTGGHFCYPLDDTFIHMAVAKNLALFGNWGVAPTGFVSASSSPLFTVLLAALFKISGITVIKPFLISCAGTVLMLLAMQRELNKYSHLNGLNKIICVLFTLLTGVIAPLTLLGMEHTLQIAFTLFFVHSVATLQQDSSKNNLWTAIAWAALMTATRYENASFIIAAFLLLAWQRKFVPAILIGAAGVAPLFLFGLYAKMSGGSFIPNSVLIKGNQIFKYFINGGTSILEGTHSISAIVAAAIFITIKKLREKQADRNFWIMAMLVIAGLMHSVFASFGWFYRYEAYLIVLGMFHLGKIFLEWYQQNGFAGIKQNIIIAGLVAIVFYSLPVRGLNAYKNSIRAIHNIYDQQYQMGTFLNQYYKGQTVAANDIGAITFMADLHTIDMWGLGNNEVAKARKGGYWTNDFLRKVVSDNKTRVVVMYDSWFDKDLSGQWTKVASWEMPDNYICGDSKVQFYAVTTAEAETLKANLVAFEAQLPKEIKVEYPAR